MARRLFLRQFLQALIEENDRSDYDDNDDAADIEDNGGGSGATEEDDDQQQQQADDVASADALIRALLFRHGHPERSQLRRGNTEEEETEYRHAIEERKSRLQQHDFARIIRTDVGMLQKDDYHNDNVFGLLHARERNDPSSNTRPRVANIARRYIPNTCRSVLGGHRHQVFCGQFSQDGSIFMSASQDQTIRMYHTDNIEYSIAKRKQATPFKLIHARDVGWSVVDTHFSPDQTSIIYSSWSPYVHLCTIDMDERSRHEPLDLSPPSMRFCPFSIRFSPDSREILAGANDCALYIFDIEYKRRILRIDDAHDDDINTVTFADQSPHIFFSGSDDTLIKVWDRRSFSASNNSPVGVMAGHASGLTCVSSKGDGIYFISNGKDQCMKLWDVRTMKNQGEGVPRISSDIEHWDYRYDHPVQRRIHPQDMSLMTYTGHRVLQTLVRCYFSPKETTGQNFVYTGSQDGSICIYDVLTGEMVQKLRGHTAIVRDVSWHPHISLLLSSSWDTSVRCWQWSSATDSRTDQTSPMRIDLDDNDDDDAYEEEDESEYEETGLRGIRFGMFIGSGDEEYEYIVEADDDEEDSDYEP